MVYVIIAVAALIIGALIGYLIFRYIITGKYKAEALQMQYEYFQEHQE